MSREMQTILTSPVPATAKGEQDTSHQRGSPRAVGQNPSTRVPWPSTARLTAWRIFSTSASGQSAAYSQPIT